MIRTHRRYVAEINGTEKEYVELSCDSMDTKPSVTGLINGSMLTETDTGKVYMVDEDAGEWVEQFSLQDMGGGGGSGLPPVTSADNGKVLGVEDGEWEPVEQSGGNVFTVTFTETGSSGSYSYSADKTFNEISTAASEGKDIEVFLILADGSILKPVSQGVTGGYFDQKFTARTPWCTVTKLQYQTQSTEAYFYEITYTMYGSTYLNIITYVPPQEGVLIKYNKAQGSYGTMLEMSVDGHAATYQEVQAALANSNLRNVTIRAGVFMNYGDTYVYSDYSGYTVTGTKTYVDNGVLKIDVIVLDLAAPSNTTITTYTLTTT